MSNPLSDWPVVVTIPIQWGDQDALGHVNNTIPIRWFESARIAFLDYVGLTHSTSDNALGPILAAIHCNYRRQLHFPDTVHIGSRAGRIGRTSLVIEHQVYSESHQEVTADGQSTIVVFDYETQKPVPIPESMLAKIQP